MKGLLPEALLRQFPRDTRVKRHSLKLKTGIFNDFRYFRECSLAIAQKLPSIPGAFRFWRGSDGVLRAEVIEDKQITSKILKDPLQETACTGENSDTGTTAKVAGSLSWAEHHL